MGESILQLRVVWHDIHLVELGIEVRHGNWSATSTAYAGWTFLTSDMAKLIEWARVPSGPIRLLPGDDTGASWFAFELTSDLAGHVRCLIRLSSGVRGPEPAWRFELVMPSELGLVERFGRECVALGRSLQGEATLIGLSV